MSTASYFKDEAGVHLSLHITAAEYKGVMGALACDGEVLTGAVYDLLARAERHESAKQANPREIRFDDPQPLRALSTRRFPDMPTAG